MQHFDIATVRASAIVSDDVLARFLGAVDTVVIPEGETFPVDVTIGGLPVDDFSVECEALLEMPRQQRHRHFKASTKARDLFRHNARAAKRASSYIA